MSSSYASQREAGLVPDNGADISQAVVKMGASGWRPLLSQAAREAQRCAALSFCVARALAASSLRSPQRALALEDLASRPTAHSRRALALKDSASRPAHSRSKGTDPRNGRYLSPRAPLGGTLIIGSLNLWVFSMGSLASSAMVFSMAICPRRVYASLAICPRRVHTSLPIEPIPIVLLILWNISPTCNSYLKDDQRGVAVEEEK